MVGWRCSGEEHVALRLVATLRWHKGSNLNAHIIFFKNIYKFFYRDSVSDSDCTSLPSFISRKIKIIVTFFLIYLCLGSDGGTRFPVSTGLDRTI